MLDGSRRKTGGAGIELYEGFQEEAILLAEDNCLSLSDDF